MTEEIQPAAEAAPSPDLPNSVNAHELADVLGSQFNMNKILGGSDEVEATEATEDSGTESDLEPEIEAASEEEAPEEESVQSDESEESDVDAEETVELSQLDQLSELLDLDPEQFQKLKTVVKVDGEEIEVDFDELKRGYQREASYTRKSQKFAEDKRAWEGQQAEQRQQLEKSLQMSQMVAQVARQRHVEQLQALNASDLKTSDPQAYIEARDYLESQVKGIDDAYQQLAAEYNQAEQKTRAERLKVEQERLREAVPDFGESHAKTFYEVASTFGFSPEELKGVTDHRMILFALEHSNMKRELEDLRSREAQAKANMKVKVKKAKVNGTARPGGPAKPSDVRAKKIAEAKRKLVGKTGKSSVDAAAELIGLINKPTKGKRK